MLPPIHRTRPILCIDFDGVIHRYSRGWQGGEIYDDATPGFFEWAIQAAEYFELVIYSSRSKTKEGRDSMQEWLDWQAGAWRRDGGPERWSAKVPVFTFAHEKPPAFLTIDDRALTFNGNWSDFAPSFLADFRPWTAEQKNAG